ncbi:MAG: DNA mismatch repair endonuclease MutL [Oscillatoriales cyanobacterium]|nr:MAG: DNA mismatch repair endonuclease MutL [Oscillatoriales cyanobacterium]
MATSIQPLPIEVVNLMAAGETIDAPAAVVREAIDNAIDAGATRLAVALWLDRGCIRISDNGGGMTREDLLCAAAPHSTSKIRDRPDLFAIRSLGFRGEALHSLAQLSQLTIASRVANQAGWQATYNPTGEVRVCETVPIAPGTIVTVDQLFGSWPARRDSLPSIAQQLRAIQTTIHNAALCHPAVAWTVYRDDRLWFALSPGDSVRHLLPQILRQVRSSDLQSVDWVADLPPDVSIAPDPSQPAPADQSRIEVTLALPDRLHRARPDWVRVAVNGRMADVPEIEQAIFASFGRTLPRGRFPISLVHLHLPPQCIDWNRAPDKRKLYLQPIDHWQAQVQAAIAQAFALPNTDSEPATQAYAIARTAKLLRAAEQRPTYQTATASPDQPPTDPEPLGELGHGERLGGPLRAIAQVHNTYIVAEHPGGLWLVEQHIAHERVLFEQLRDRWQILPLDSPVVLHDFSEPERDLLVAIGLEIDPFGDRCWLVRSLPAPLVDRPDAIAALRELAQTNNLEAAQVAVACRTAVRNGQPLTLGEMQDLLDRWQRTQNPRTCPHGRPIHLSLEESSLARFFRRHWVIGKSHGI